MAVSGSQILSGPSPLQQSSAVKFEVVCFGKKCVGLERLLRHLPKQINLYASSNWELNHALAPKPPEIRFAHPDTPWYTHVHPVFLQTAYGWLALSQFSQYLLP